MIPRAKLAEKSETVTVEMKPKTARSHVAVARRAFVEGRARTIKFREKQLKQLRKFYTENEQKMLDVLNKDTRRPKHESYLFEIDFVKNDLKNVMANFKDWIEPIEVKKKIIFPLDSVKIMNDPLGVIFIIGAWNYPLRAALLPIASAIASGNCVIVMPSPICSNTNAFLVETLPKYLDEDCYQLYNGDLKEILKERFDYIFFTGEKYIAAQVAKAAALYKTPTTLIIGGKNPVYLDDSANFEIAARRILWGNCVNSGQTCLGPEYVLCSKEAEKKFLKAAEKILREFYGEEPKNSEHYARIISDKHFEKVIKHLEGHKVALGGQYDKKERYIQPTILIDVNPNSAIMDEEIQGPILPIVNVDNIEKAIAFINAREKPLAMYIFSKNKKNINLLLESTSAGGVTVNDTLMHTVPNNLPFGGVGQSGLGSCHGKRTFDSFVHKKSVFMRPQCALWEKIEVVRYPPYSENKRKLLSLFMAHRRDVPWTCLSYIAVFLIGMLITAVAVFIFETQLD